jgi:hypothetical protein
MCEMTAAGVPISVGAVPATHTVHEKFAKGPGKLGMLIFGLVLIVSSSGIAGTMAANRSGLQMSTVRNPLLAWVLTLPVAMMLSGFLFWTFRRMFA